MRRIAGIAALLAALGAAAAAAPASPPGAAAAKRAPKVEQLVVFRDGSVRQRTVRATATTVEVGRRRCGVGAATPLAALKRSRPGPLEITDFGSCSRRAADGAGLFVRAIGPDRSRGQDGWVYKVGRRAATAGAADPAGPFGNGRLRAGQRVTWYFCRLREGGCQRTLEISATTEPGAVVATVRGYDDEGRGALVEGASVSAERATAVTGADGVARLALPAGRHRVVAHKDGMIRSFAERVEVP